jgi:hypothetical protein
MCLVADGYCDYVRRQDFMSNRGTQFSKTGLGASRKFAHELAFKICKTIFTDGPEAVFLELPATADH